MSAKKNENVDEALYEKERWYSHSAALAIGLFFIVIGIPIWWQTTTVYRAELPYHQIKEVFRTTPSLRIDVEVVLQLKELDPVKMSQLGEHLQEVFSALSTSTDYIHIKYRGSLRLANEDELKLLQKISKPSDTDSLSSPSNNAYTVYLTNSAKDAELPYINSNREIFMKLPADTDKIVELMPELKRISSEIFRPAALSRSFQVVHGAPLNDRELLRSLKFDSSYTVVFSLLVPEPDNVLATWDMTRAVKEYLFDFEEAVGKYVDLKIKSQVLYYEALAIKPKKHKTDDYHYLTQAEMPHLINPIEARLSSFVDTNPTLNFLVYVPTSKQYPLHLQDKDGKKFQGNSFLVPRWGGFYIHNVNTTSDTIPIKHEIDLGPVLTEILPQLKSLLGFSQTATNEALNRSPMLDSSISQWELDQWMRQKTVENIGTSTHALYSLSNLVQNIRNMVINDDISKQVSKSVDSILMSYKLLSNGETEQAFKASKLGLRCAERAFFDTSLLELLYFPEDQKFAIYIPLFLPIGLPIIGSMVTAMKWFKGGAKQSEKSVNTSQDKSDKPKSE